jgi:O-succinylbenzoic acid--CoA ligase
MFIIPFSTAAEQEVIQIAKQKLEHVTEEWEQDIWRFLLLWFTKGIDSIEVFSSGSTGKPKSIQHSKVAVLAHAKMTCETLCLEKGDTAWLCLPANKIGGIMMIVRSIVNRMDLLCSKPSIHPFEDIEQEHSVAFTAFTPMQMKSAFSSNNSFLKMSRIKNILLGGETVGTELMKNLRSANNNIYSTFGMTETISHIALKRVNGVSPDSFYKTLNTITIDKDERSCLVVNAPMIGIANLITNDLIKLQSEREFNWLGRIDNVINTGGVKVYPELIEEKLMSFIEVPFFVAGVADELTGEKVVLVLETETCSEKDREKLEYFFKILQKYEQPKEILFTPKFARTENGKVKRKETLEMCIV